MIPFDYFAELQDSGRDYQGFVIINAYSEAYT